MHKAAAILSLALLLAACGLFDDEDGSGNLDTNSPPTVELSASPVSGSAPLEVTLTATASDPDGDALSYSWSLDGLPDAATVTTELTEVGEYPITVTVSDGEEEASALVTVTVTAEGTDPTDPTDATDPANPTDPSDPTDPDPTDTTDPTDPEPQIIVEATPGGPVPWGVRYDVTLVGYPEGSRVIFTCNTDTEIDEAYYSYDDNSYTCLHLSDDEDIEIEVIEQYPADEVLAKERFETDLEPASEVPFGGTWRYTEDDNPPLTFTITQAIGEFAGSDTTGDFEIRYGVEDEAGYIYFSAPVFFSYMYFQPQPLEDGTQRFIALNNNGILEKID